MRSSAPAFPPASRTSTQTQRDACRAKALALSLAIIAEYHDGGISGGFLLARPGMQLALADIQAGRADTLICPNLSRYSRDVEHQQAVKKAVRAAGGRLVFCDMEFADTPEGDLNFTIQGGFAEYEKAVIKKRTGGGRQKKAEQGIQPSRKIRASASSRRSTHGRCRGMWGMFFRRRKLR